MADEEVAYNQHLNMVLGDGEETTRTVEMNKEIYEVYCATMRNIPKLFGRRDVVTLESYNGKVPTSLNQLTCREVQQQTNIDDMASPSVSRTHLDQVHAQPTDHPIPVPVTQRSKEGVSNAIIKPKKGNKSQSGNGKGLKNPASKYKQPANSRIKRGGTSTLSGQSSVKAKTNAKPSKTNTKVTNKSKGMTKMMQAVIHNCPP